MALGGVLLMALGGVPVHASGPGLFCSVVVSLAPAQVGALAPGAEVWFEDAGLLPGAVYALAASGAVVSLGVYEVRYLGWGWKCLGELCVASTAMAEAGATGCLVHGASDRWLRLRNEGEAAATYALAAPGALAP